MMLKNSNEMHISGDLDKFRLGYKGDAKFKDRLRRQFDLLKSWSVSRTNVAIAQKLEKRFGTVNVRLVSSKQTSHDADDKPMFPTVSISAERSSQVQELVNEYTNTNFGLSGMAKDDFFANAQSKIFQGLREGKTFRSIADELEKLGGGISRSKAESWIRDQSGKFFGTLTRLEQTESGIPGYIWKITGYHTRDQHSKLAGTFHKWDKRPKMLYGTRTTEAHPGEDYNCRCWAEPAFGDEPDVKPWKDEWTATGSEQSLNAGDVVIDDTFSSFQTISIRKGIVDVNRTLDITPATDKQKFAFLPMTKAHSEFFNSDGFYDPFTGEIFIKPGIEYLELAVYHETYHKLDKEYLSVSTIRGIETPDAMELLYAIHQTNSFRSLNKLWVQNNNIMNMIYTFRKDSEWIARIFEQFISLKQEKGTLVNEIDKRNMDFAKRYNANYYLTKNELDKVLPLFENYLRKKGLLK
ncbi:MAG: phage head morphogenesis protein [Leptospiraceae bacterium]|nr:phage head morphogenesis protein [Leptospiraceae bacterium]